jgi:hypothetical protein
VQVPNAANLNPASALTLDAWIFPTDTFGTIISKYDASGGQQVSYLLELNSAALALPFTVRGMLVEAS